VARIFSVGNEDLMSENDLILLENGISEPKGSFVDVSYVIPTIVSVLKEPEKLPETVRWKNNDEIYLSLRT